MGPILRGGAAKDKAALAWCVAEAVAVALALKAEKAHPELVIPAKAGIHFALDLQAAERQGKIKMDPSFRWDDVRVFGGAMEKPNSTNNKPAFRRVRR